MTSLLFKALDNTCLQHLYDVERYCDVTQIAKALGARVIAVCRGSNKADALRRLGADAVIESSQQNDTPLRALIKVSFPLHNQKVAVTLR